MTIGATDSARRPRQGAALLATLISCLLGPAGCATHTAAPSAPAVAATPPAALPTRPVLVTVVVDQLAAWMAAERWPQLPRDGGFARLRSEGLYVREMRYDHAVTDTAPGHSALFTGAVPRESGIFGNEVILREGTDPVSILADPRTRVVAAGIDKPIDRSGSSLAPLLVDTVADRLIGDRPDAQIFSFSLKDRGALFAAGRHPTMALWFDPALEAFVTSTAFTRRLPDWVTPVGGSAAVRRALGATWDLSDRAWVAGHAETPDDQPGEANYEGLGTTFPHRITSAKALRATPVGDDLLFALAAAALAQAANAPDASSRPVLLSLSLSSHDYVGHLFGPHSWEAWDEMRRLDHRLAELLALLDRTFGRDRYAVMLTADHGSNSLPELADREHDAWCQPGVVDHWERGCGRGLRLEQAAIIETLEEALDPALLPPPPPPPEETETTPTSDSSTAPAQGGGLAPGVFDGSAPHPPHWIAGIADPLLFLTERARALPPSDRARLVQIAAQVLHDRFDIDDVVDIHAKTEPCPPPADQSVSALVCRSLRPDGPADLYLVVHRRSFFDPRYATGHGTSHGSPYLYDRAVPLIVRAPGRVPAGMTRDTPVSFASFARTAASLLGVHPPDAARGAENLAVGP
jgi:arylsulfatase A-like enzyme